MDAIDITDATFALNVSSVAGSWMSNDYLYIYIAIAVAIVLAGIFVYQMYRRNDASDCDGGFCTMGEQPHTTQ